MGSIINCCNNDKTDPIKTENTEKLHLSSPLKPPRNGLSQTCFVDTMINKKFKEEADDYDNVSKENSPEKGNKNIKIYPKQIEEKSSKSRKLDFTHRRKKSEKEKNKPFPAIRGML